MQPHHIGDVNVERLLGASYKPEAPDAACVEGLRARVEATARALADRAPAPRPEEEHLRKVRRRLGWAMALAAAVAGVALLVRAADRPEAAAKARPGDVEETVAAPDPARGVPWAGDSSLGLTPRPRSAEGPDEVKVAVGAELQTRPGHARRVTLADGSVLYLNADPHVCYLAERQVRLVRGELYVEVAPRPAGQAGATFVVQAPDREVQALGTRFGVWADGGRSGV